MREYIFEKTKNTTRYIKFGNIDVIEIDQITNNIDLQAIFRSLEDLLPSKFFNGLKQIRIEHLPEFDQRNANAIYKDGIFYISNKQEDANDIIDDIVHEFAHHIEMLYPNIIYADQDLKKEFLQKRFQLNFEARSEGYWTKDYDFENLQYNKDLDDFLYQRIGPKLLKMMVSGIFIRPYAAVSIREYFATGMEAYFLGKKEKLKDISPVLYNKIDTIVKDN